MVNLTPVLVRDIIKTHVDEIPKQIHGDLLDHLGIDHVISTKLNSAKGSAKRVAPLRVV